MSGDNPAARLDTALAAAARAVDESNLAEILVGQAAVLTGADAATVIEVLERDVRTVAQVGNSSAPPIDDLGADEVRAACASGQSPVSVTSPSGWPATVFVIPAKLDTVLCLVVPGRFTGRIIDEVALLTDVAGATIDRLHAERELRRHSDRVRQLGADLMGLADSTTIGEAPAPPDPDIAATTAELTDREREILEIVTTGASNAQIAAQLTVSVETVKTHVKHILRKLNAANRSELIAAFGGGPQATGSNRPPGRGSHPDPR
ncbi:response regulator transcription factor [Gordonia sp. NPDC003424]